MTMSSSDTQWIQSAHNVLSASDSAMHVDEIEKVIRSSNMVPEGPSMSLEVLLTKEAAMGRKFTKPEGASTGFFSLLTTQATSGEMQSCSPSQTENQSESTSQTDTALSSGIKYQYKYNQLKKTCKQLIYLNAALYDEINRLEQKIESTSSERKALLKKVMADQNIVNHNAKSGGPQSMSVAESGSSAKTKTGKKKNLSSLSPPAKKRKVSGETVSEEENPISSATFSKKSQKKSKEDSRIANSIKIPSISLDSSGRPILPIELAAGLTIYSIGEISDKSGYCTANSIYPVGYCCTREYAAIDDISSSCLYTCKVTEGQSGPQFEISPDSDPDILLVDSTPDKCHDQLLKLITENTDHELATSTKSDFFGLKHPLIRNLLQCSQGANNCLEYQWCMFEVVKNNSKLTAVPSENDVTSSYKALVEHLLSTETV